MSGLSADEIKEMQARADAKRRRRSPKPPSGGGPRPDRMTFADNGDTATLTIELGPPFRGREAYVGLLVVPTFAGAMGAYTEVGALAAAGVVLAFIGIIAALIVTAPPLRLQMTRTDAFILYKGNPRRPMWTGALADLRFDFMRAAAARHWIPMLYFQPTRKDKRTAVLGLANANEVAVMRTAATWAGVQVNGLD